MRRISGVLLAASVLSGCMPGAIEGSVAIPVADRDLPCGGRRIVAVPASPDATRIMSETATGRGSAVDAVMSGPLAAAAHSATCEGTRFRIEGLAPGRWTVFTDPRLDGEHVMQIMHFAEVKPGETEIIGIIP